MNDNDLQLQTPVLFLIFNRLDTTKQVFEAIRQSQPPRLYVAADGARESREGEVEKVQAVRDYIVTNVDWDCEVKTLFREKNLGCRIAVSSAIDWFFDNEEQGIILEDDCIPDLSFFYFCQQLLEKYRDDERIMSIVAPNIKGNIPNWEYSYCFSRYSLMWGWATWKRAWQYYDSEMTNWPTLKQTEWLLTIGDGSKKFKSYWSYIFDNTYNETINSWAFRWMFSCWCQNGLAIIPSVNLIRNIGFGSDATHTKKESKILTNLIEKSMNFPLKHPRYITRNYKIDNFIDENWFKNSVISRIKLTIKKILYLARS